MDSLKMRTPDLAAEKYAKLAELFPNAVTESTDENGTVVRAVDPDILQQEINTHVLSGKEERYQFTWPDKRKSVLLANAPIAAALRPCREESVDFDTTENLYIEGDNLDVLKLLRETYLNRVKMIYIDPPYNTGNDFVYEDDFAEGEGEFLHRDRQYDDGGNRLTRNLDSNGRFHTDWLNMMYPRLRIARDLMTDDGIIFVSCDDNEVHNLKKMLDEIYGSDAFITMFIWEKRVTRENRKIVSVRHDYILCYVKQFDMRDKAIGLLPMNQDAIDRYNNPDNDPRGVWTSVPAIAQAGHGTKNQFYTLVTPSGRSVDPPSGSCWRYTKQRMDEAIADNRMWFGQDGNGVPRIKKFLTEGRQGLTSETIWLSDDVGTNDSAKRELVSLFSDVAVFETPKPTALLKQCLQICNDTSNMICMDFFSGTATLAHAIMQLNAEDGVKRKFIMVQIPEVCDENSEAAKAGYANICEIGKERIRRAGRKIVEENGLAAQGLDIGFRVLKLDSSNMKDVYYTPEEYAQMSFNIDGFADNIKEDRTAEDLLFQAMLELGVPLSAKITRDGETWNVRDGYLIACFGQTDDALIAYIAKQKPYYAVFRDGSFESDSAMANFEQIFATYSPNTIKRVL
ncbi:MAG: site-specific DNA-methyltransferase [Oscillospiraceae bacterium]|nr:site-specific DNA-methyltransferase [Oscillospiraceae bacterium]